MKRRHLMPYATAALWLAIGWLAAPVLLTLAVLWAMP